MNEAGCGVRPEDIGRFLEEYEGGEETATQILTILAEEIPDRVKQIRKNFEAGHLETAAAVAHTLTSSVGVLGNACQTETIRELEKELRAAEENRAGRPDPDLPGSISRAEEEMGALLSAIRQALSTTRRSRD
ncbi:MAG: Hpt domain-containing protein [Spirochaetales bacterium]